MGEYQLKIMNLDEAEDVKAILESCEKADVHAHPDYLRVFQNYTGHKAIYVYFWDGRNHILIPYFERPVLLPGDSQFGPYIDLVSPWYFGGPIHNIKDSKLLHASFLKFIGRFNEHCRENGVVTEFQRLNPILRNHELYPDAANVAYDRKIVYVDLTKSIDRIHREYTRHTRKNINKAVRNRLRVYHDNSKEAISRFIEIYSKSMDRKNAESFYYFNETFFRGLFEKLKDEARLFQVEYEGKIICSSIELGRYGVLYDFLRGTDPQYILLRPNDILIDEVIKWGKSDGYRYFVMGGGSSPSEDDGLLRFKMSFSADTADFYTYKKIYNLKAYKELCRKSGKREQYLKYENAQFFPEYLQHKTGER